MKGKKILSVLLTLFMILGITPNVMAVSISEFSDMPENWSRAAIENAVSNGLLTGSNGKIMPDENLTRAQMAAILNRAFGSTEKASLESFSDVKSGSWYYDDMAKAVSMSIFKGSNGKLNPDNAITREEVFTALARAYRLTSADTSALNKFSDAASVSSWAKTSVAALVAAGYVKGTNGRLNPAANITRAEFARIMDNMVKGYITSAGTYTSISDGNVMINAANVILKDISINGDLIIGDGVGDGDVTLDSVKVSGRIVVRGGGANSIRIIGASDAGSVVVARINGEVRVVVSDHSNIQVIEVDDGSDDVFVEGKVGSIDIRAAGITVTANNARIGTAAVTGDGSKMIVGEASTVDKITLDAKRVEVQVTGTANSIVATKNAENAAVTGTGHVTGVEANANNVRVETPGTTVTAGPGTTGVINGGKPVDPGTTSTSPSGTGNSTSGSTGGDGSNNNGNNDNNNSSDLRITDLNVTANTNSDIVTVTATVTNAGPSDTAVITFTRAKDVSGPPIPAQKGDKNDVDAYTTTYSDIPVVNGKISYTIYGDLNNDTYTVKVTVGTATATKSDFILNAGISIFTEFGSEYSINQFGTGKYGVDWCVHDNGSLDAAQYAAYTYDVTVLNLDEGTSLSLISSGTLSEDDYTDLESYDFNVSGNSPDFFTTGSYAVVAKFSLNGSLAGEASFSFSILPEAPDVSIDYENESINGYNSSTMEYYWSGKIGDATWLSDTDLSSEHSLTEYIQSNFLLGLYIRVKSPQSAKVYIHFPSRPSVPSGLSASGTASASSSDGKITGLNSTHPYQYKLYTASSWSDASAAATEISGLAAGIYYVRLKATSSSFCSMPATINVFDTSAPIPEAPSLESAIVSEAAPGKLLLKFSKDMSETGINTSDFTVTGKSRYPYSNYEAESISSVVLNSSDPSIVELTLNSNRRADYKYTVSYTSGTTISAEGIALASFSNQAVDNQLIYTDMAVTLLSNANIVNYKSYGEVSVSNISLSDGSEFFTSYSYGYRVCSDSSTAPAPGTCIDDIDGVTTGDFALYHLAKNNIISAGDYLLMYVYDKTDNNRVYSFGQVRILEENIGKGWSEINISTIQSNYSYITSALREQPQKVFYVILSEEQNVTAIGGDDADLVSADTSNPNNPIYTMDTSSISTTGGALSFILTIQDSSIDDSYDVTLKVDIKPVTPTVAIVSGKLYVTGATPGFTIEVCSTTGSFYTGNLTIPVGPDGTVEIDPGDLNSGNGLPAGDYYVKQGIDDVLSDQSNIIQYVP